MDEVVHRAADPAETTAANRAWWDEEATAYYAEHGRFLGDSDFVWGPEGLREADAHLLGDLAGRRVLEIGAGGAQCARWVQAHGALVVATDLSMGMLHTAAAINQRLGPHARVPLAQCDGLALPFAAASFDLVFTAYGVMPFVADSQRVLHEVCRVLRPGGTFVFSTTHPFRWTLPDEPGSAGLVVRYSYWDRTPYVEQDVMGHATYVEHHRTIGDRVRECVAAGLQIVDLIEPTWPPDNHETWGGWSPQRGALIPGTLIVVAAKPGQPSVGSMRGVMPGPAHPDRDVQRHVHLDGV